MVLISHHDTKTIYQLENKKSHHHTKICEKYNTKVCRPNKMKKKNIKHSTNSTDLTTHLI